MGEANQTTNKPTKTSENGDFKPKEFREPFSLSLSINDNIVCRRYFKVDELLFDALECVELKQVMDEIWGKICADLEHKRRIDQDYSSNLPLKLTGFIEDLPDIPDTGIGGERFMLANAIFSSREDGKMQLPDGRILDKTFYRPATFEDKYGDYDRPADGEVILKLALRFQGRTIYERAWDGNVYPRYVRGSIDLTNSDEAYRDEDPEKLNFTLAMNRRMTMGRTDLVQEAITKLTELLSGKWGNEEDGGITRYDFYGNNNTVRETEGHLPIPRSKVEVLGHLDIEPQDRDYFCSSYNRDYVEGWRNATAEKTKAYYHPLSAGSKNHDKREKQSGR